MRKSEARGSTFPRGVSFRSFHAGDLRARMNSTPRMAESTPKARPSARWTIGDVLDFECLLAADGLDGENLRRRDREIYLRDIAPVVGEGASRRVVFHRWLESLRGNRDSAPGFAIDHAVRWARALAALGGLILGGGLAGALLSYHGAEPVDVTRFVLATLGTQWLLLTLLILGALWNRRAPVGHAGFHPVRSMATGLVNWLAARFQHLGGETRQTWAARLGTLEKLHRLHSPLAVWAGVVVTQIFAVAFNAGIVAVLLVRVTTTDLAFGWQSTLRASPEAVHRIASAAALPWSWLAPEACPTPAEVAGSRFEPSLGRRQLDPKAARAWWPFLLAAVIVYGLMVRLSLFTWAAWHLRKSLRCVALDHSACNALWRRLVGPEIEAQPPAARPGPGAPEPAHVPRTSQRWFALVATELSLDEPTVAGAIRDRLGGVLSAMQKVDIDLASSATGALAAVRATDAGVVVMVPAIRDPILGIKKTLQRISEAAAGRTTLLLLAGPPDRARVWRKWGATEHLDWDIEIWPRP